MVYFKNWKNVFNKGAIFETDFTVSEQVYNGFITIFNDQNPLHTNESFAKEKGFNSKVMHGNILNGFLSYFIGEVLPIKNVIIHAQEIKYAKPVYLNDELLLQAIVNEVHQSVSTIEFGFKFFRIRDKDLVARGKIQIGLI